jgi:hypothetical protein
LSDKIEKNEMGGASTTYRREDRCIQVLVGNLTERYHLEDPGLDGKIMLRYVFRKRDGGHGRDSHG